MAHRDIFTKRRKSYSNIGTQKTKEEWKESSKEKGREPREKNPQIYDRKSIPERSKLLKEAHEICPNCFKKVEGDVIPRHIFCMYCGAKLKIRFILKEKAEKVLKNSETQNFETQKLSFCNECGALMFSVKVNDILVMKCKCGATKPFNENMANAYKIKTKINHSFNEESIYQCLCTKKFQSSAEFLDHTRDCKTSIIQNNINLLKRKGTFIFINISLLKNIGSFSDRLRFTIFNNREISINTYEKISKKMRISVSALSKEIKFVIDQSLNSQVLSKLSYMRGLRYRNQSYKKGFRRSNLLLTIISVIGPILQQCYALGYDQEKIFKNIKFFHNKQRVEDWTKYILKMTSAEALIYFKGFRNYYGPTWWHQNFAVRKEFLTNIIPGYSDIDLKSIYTEDDDSSVKKPKWD